MLKFYTVNNDYIEYLRKFDPRIYKNNDRRPYIGVVCSVNNIDYYVPLSSPKPKHLNMKNTKDFHKVKEGALGVINFNYMIPISTEYLLEKDIRNEPDLKYRFLLNNQYIEVIKIEDIITSKANDLYSLVKMNDNDLTEYDKRLKTRCCNFPLLEQKMKEYINQKES